MNKKKLSRSGSLQSSVTSVLAALLCILIGLLVGFLQHAGKLKRETVAPMKVKSFDLKDVRLLPSRFRENMMRDSMKITIICSATPMAIFAAMRFVACFVIATFCCYRGAVWISKIIVR